MNIGRSFSRRALVLGIGNILWADDGFGIRALETLEKSGFCPPEVALVDGGTRGLGLLSLVRETEKLLLFDAVDSSNPPGTLRIFRNEEIPQVLSGARMNLHLDALPDVLALARLFGEYPEDIRLIGVQPAVLDDFGGSLSTTVAEILPNAVRMALAILEEWGCPILESGHGRSGGSKETALA